MSPSLSWAQRGWSMICFTTGPIGPSPAYVERERVVKRGKVKMNITHNLHWSKTYASKQLYGSETSTLQSSVSSHTYNITSLATHTDTDVAHIQPLSQLFHTHTQHAVSYYSVHIRYSWSERGNCGANEWQAGGLVSEYTSSGPR